MKLENIGRFHTGDPYPALLESLEPWNRNTHYRDYYAWNFVYWIL